MAGNNKTNVIRKGKHQKNGGCSGEATSATVVTWIIVLWVNEKKYSIQPEDTVLAAEILEDPNKVGDIFYIGEGPAALQHPYRGAKIYPGRVIDKNESRSVLEEKLPEIMKNGPSAKSIEISKKGPDSEAWKRRSRLIQEAEFRSSPQVLELKTEVEELKRTVTKLKTKLKDQNALEERLARLEAAAEKSSGKYYITKEEAETLFRTLEDRKDDEMLKVETEILQHMNQLDLHHAKYAANFRQMTSRLMDSIFGDEMRNNTISTLDSAKISLITRYVMLCRATMERDCTERSIRYKIRRCLDNRASYQKRKQTGKLRKPPVKTPKRKEAPEVALRSSSSSDDDDSWNNTTVKKFRLSGTNEMLDQEVSDY